MCGVFERERERERVRTASIQVLYPSYGTCSDSLGTKFEIFLKFFFSLIASQYRCTGYAGRGIKQDPLGKFSIKMN